MKECQKKGQFTCDQLNCNYATSRKNNLERHKITHSLTHENVPTENEFCVGFMEQNLFLITSGTKISVLKIEENNEFSLKSTKYASCQILTLNTFGNKIIVNEKNELQCFLLKEDLSLEEVFDIYYENEIKKTIMLKNDFLLLSSLNKIDILDSTQSVVKSFTSNDFILDIVVCDTEDFVNDYLFVVCNNNKIFGCNLNNVLDGDISENFTFIGQMKTMTVDSIFFSNSGKSLFVSTEDSVFEISLIFKNEPINADLKELECRISLCMLDHMVSC